MLSLLLQGSNPVYTFPIYALTTSLMHVPLEFTHLGESSEKMAVSGGNEGAVGRVTLYSEKYHKGEHFWGVESSK